MNGGCQSAGNLYATKSLPLSSRQVQPCQADIRAQLLFATVSTRILGAVRVGKCVNDDFRLQNRLNLMIYQKAIRPSHIPIFLPC
jgi:hypothetical protein